MEAKKHSVAKKSYISREVRLSDLDGIKAALKFLIERERSKDLTYTLNITKNEHLYTQEQENEVIYSIKKSYEVILEGLK